MAGLSTDITELLIGMLCVFDTLLACVWTQVDHLSESLAVSRNWLKSQGNVWRESCREKLPVVYFMLEQYQCLVCSGLLCVFCRPF